jgi:hypothetical protein
MSEADMMKGRSLTGSVGPKEWRLPPVEAKAGRSAYACRIDIRVKTKSDLHKEAYGASLSTLFSATRQMSAIALGTAIEKGVPCRVSVVDPYSFFPDPDPEFPVGDQYGFGSGFRIRIQIQYGSRALMTKNWKKITAENFFIIFFDQKLQFTYP